MRSPPCSTAGWSTTTRTWRVWNDQSARFQLPLPETIGRIKEIQRELISRNELKDGLVYIQVTRGADKGRDFAFPKGVKPTLMMFTSVKDILNAASAKTGIGVITVPDIRWSRRDIKSVALLAQVLASRRRRKPAPAKPG